MAHLRLAHLTVGACLAIGGLSLDTQGDLPFERRLTDDVRDGDYLPDQCGEGAGAIVDGFWKDNTPGCYLTNYVVAAVCLLAVCIVRPLLPEFRPLGVYFTMTGWGNLILGMMHQHWYDNEALPVRFGYMFLVWGCVGLAVYGNLLSIGANLGGFLGFFLPPALIMLMFFTGVAGSFIGVGIGLIMTYAYVATIWGPLFLLFPDFWRFLKSVAPWIMAAGKIVQFWLADECGAGGYRDCFARCPLPAPTFNHNALFHSMWALGLLMMAVALAVQPDLVVNVVEDDLEIEAKRTGAAANPVQPEAVGSPTVPDEAVPEQQTRAAAEGSSPSATGAATTKATATRPVGFKGHMDESIAFFGRLAQRFSPAKGDDSQ